MDQANETHKKRESRRGGIAVVRNGAIGDTIVLFPLLAALRAEAATAEKSARILAIGRSEAWEVARLHHIRRSGDSMDRVASQEILFEGILPGLALESGPDGYIYYSIFFSPSGAIARLKYDESLLPPVTVAVRGNVSVGGLMTVYVSSKPQEPVVNPHYPFEDYVVALIGDPIEPVDTQFGTLQISNIAGMMSTFDEHGVAEMPLLIPDDANLQGITTNVQAFRVFGSDGYCSGVTASPVPFTIQ